MQHDLSERAVENGAISHVFRESERGKLRVSMIDDERANGRDMNENGASVHALGEEFEERDGLADAERGERGNSEGEENEIDEVVENGRDFPVENIREEDFEGLDALRRVVLRSFSLHVHDRVQLVVLDSTTQSSRNSYDNRKVFINTKQLSYRIDGVSSFSTLDTANANEQRREASICILFFTCTSVNFSRFRKIEISKKLHATIATRHVFSPILQESCMSRAGHRGVASCRIQSVTTWLS